MFNILGYWLRWFFKCSRLPTPGVLVKHIIIGAQGPGSDPPAGQIRRSVANSSLSSFQGSRSCVARSLMKSQSRRSKSVELTNKLSKSFVPLLSVNGQKNVSRKMISAHLFLCKMVMTCYKKWYNSVTFPYFFKK